MGTNVKYLADKDFEANAKSGGLVIVDFMAPWCAPCNQMAPVLEELAAEYAGDVTIFKMDVDQDGETARRLGIRALPTFLFLKDGVEVARELGSFTKTKFAEMVEARLT